jgi:monofunctional biosynthetic peptidoglycan transglycosylase
MERTLSKRRIVELYLNVAEWGDGIFGIEAAARHYFSKHASNLSPEEASRLATVLPNPRRFNPVGNSKYVQNRSARIYRIMVARGIVIPEYEEVMSAPEEKIEVTAAGTLAGVTGTAGITPPSKDSTQENPSYEPRQETEKTNPADAASPGAAGNGSSAPHPGEGAGNN